MNIKIYKFMECYSCAQVEICITILDNKGEQQVMSRCKSCIFKGMMEFAIKQEHLAAKTSC